jgi:hypothetical protein
MGMEEEKRMAYISEGQIAEYVYKRLVELGYAPTSDEVFDLAEIFMDFLFEHSVVIDEGEED